MLPPTIIPLLLLLLTTSCSRGAATHSDQQQDVVRLFVSYCPTDFTGAGAVVDVNPLTGTWTIMAHVRLPSSEVFGCTADYNPSFDFPQNSPSTLWMDFVSDDGAFLEVDLVSGSTTRVVSPDPFFTGFIDFKMFPQDGALHGITGTVSESGFCSDGCLGYGIQDVTSRRYHQVSFIPFKAGADDTSFADWAAGTLAFQGSYDLRTTPCGPRASSQCLVTINTTTGALVSAIHTPDYQVFKFDRSYIQPTTTIASASQGVLSFALGNLCSGGGASSNWTYQFLSVDMSSANATVVSCVDPTLVLDEDEWVAGFSTDHTMLATGSGNGNGDDPQLVVLNVTSGAVILNTPLTGLAKALGGSMGLVFVWALQFAETTQP